MSCLVSHLSYRPPYRFPELLAFFRDRALAHVELVDDVSYTRTVRLEDRDGNVACGWVRVEDDSAGNQLVVTMSDELVPAVSEVIARVRRMFDTDSDPVAISQALSPLDEAVRGVRIDGVRVPGCFDTFEIACRAVIGQQVSVRAANKLAGRIVERYGERIETGIEGLDRTWPGVTDVRSLACIEDAFGELGLIKTRSRAIDAMATAIDEGELDLDIGAVAEEQMEALLRIRGIGPWSANYIAMRTMSYPDAFLETDAGVAHALPELTPKERLALVEDCRPWRSYAVLALWDSLSGRRTRVVKEACMFYCSECESPVGTLTIASDGQAVCGLWLDGQKYHGATIPEKMVPDDDAVGFAELRAWLEAYFAGDPQPISDVPLAPRGSEFQQAVWKRLIAIPHGELTTYGAIASELKRERGKASALAVGGAVGHNPISIIIPCHRVVGSDGSLTGYAGGIERKLWLLEHEGVDTGELYVPKRGTAL